MIFLVSNGFVQTQKLMISGLEESIDEHSLDHVFRHCCSVLLLLSHGEGGRGRFFVPAKKKKSKGRSAHNKNQSTNRPINQSINQLADRHDKRENGRSS